MRALVLAAVLVLAPAVTHAADVDARGLVILTDQTSQANTALSLPGIDLGNTTGEAALLLGGDAGHLRWRVRASAGGELASGWPSHSQARLKELSYNQRLDEAWSYSVGLQQRSWDSTNLQAPLSFFRSTTDLSDPFDTYGRVAGLPMIVLTRLGEKVNLEAIVSDNFDASTKAARLNGQQAAIRLSGEPLPGLNAAVILRQRAGASLGVGFSSNYATDHFEVHADAFYGPPEARLLHQMFVGGPTGLASTDPFVLIRSAPNALHSSVGVSFTPTSNFSVEVDWSHRDDGLTQAGWDRYVAAADGHRAALAGPQARLAFQNLAWDLTAYSGAARKDHLLIFARAGDVGSASILVSPDGSAIANLNATWKVTSRVNLGVGGSAYLGNSRSEFGALPFKGSVTGSLSARF